MPWVKYEEVEVVRYSFKHRAMIFDWTSKPETLGRNFPFSRNPCEVCGATCYGYLSCCSPTGGKAQGLRVKAGDK